MDNLNALNDFFEFMQSPTFSRINISFALLSIVLAIGLVALAFTYFGRGREDTSIQPTIQPWVLVIATLRDSFLITVLYLAYDFIYRYTIFVDSTSAGVPSVFLYVRYAEPYLTVIIMVLILTIAFIRLQVLTRWLVDQKAE